MAYSNEIQQLLSLDSDCLPLEDYTVLGLTVNHADELIRMATDPQLLLEDEESRKFWGAVHAWQALGQFKVLEAVSPLLDLIAQYPFDLLFDQDLPRVFESMGKGVISELSSYLNNNAKPKESREAAVCYLGGLGKAYAQESIAVLNEFLSKAEDNDIEINAFAVGSLINIGAKESIEIIRQAYSKNRIDINIPGDLEDVEIELGFRKTRDTPKPRYNAEYLDYESETVKLPPKIGRNEPCPCGSGKKYKKCCLN